MSSPPESILTELGSTFLDRYRPGAVLGRGASGLVFKATQASLDRPVVVKVLRLDATQVDQLKARFGREAAILARLEHPAVVPVLDFGEAGSNLYLVYPDQGGVSLLHWLAARGPAPGTTPLPAELVTGLLLDLLAGLDHVHRAGVVHRDLKPSNVLVLPDGTAQLIDFGLARPIEPGTTMTRTGAIVGTPQYLSPAQIQCLPPDPRDDLYSLGVMAYELLTGTMPFLSSDIAQILNRHLSLEPAPAHELVPGVPRPLSILVADMMAKAREDRPASAAAARARLGAPGPATGAAPSTAAAPAPRAGAPPPGARPSFSSGVGAGLVLGLAVAFGAARGPPRAAGPDPAPTPAAVGAATAFPPADYAARVARELDAHAAPDLDPLAWPGLAAELPEAGRLPAWVARGGRPEELAPALADALRGLDARYQGLGLDPPFHPFLYVAPEPEARLPDPVLPAPLRALGPRRGWAGAAAGALVRLHAARAELARRAAAATPARGPEGLAAAPWALFQAYQAAGARDFMVAAPRLYSLGPAARIGLAAWVAPARRALLEAVWAAARAGREEPGTAAPLALALADELDAAGPVLLGPPAHVLPWPLFGGRPETPPAALLAATWLANAAKVHRDAGGDAETMDDEAGRLLALAATAEPADDPGAELLGRAAAALARGGATPFEDVAARLAAATPARQAAVLGALADGVRHGRPADQAPAREARLRTLVRARLPGAADRLGW